MDGLPNPSIPFYFYFYSSIREYRRALKIYSAVVRDSSSEGIVFSCSLDSPHITHLLESVVDLLLLVQVAERAHTPVLATIECLSSNKPSSVGVVWQRVTIGIKHACQHRIAIPLLATRVAPHMSGEKYTNNVGLLGHCESERSIFLWEMLNFDGDAREHRALIQGTPLHMAWLYHFRPHKMVEIITCNRS